MDVFFGLVFTSHTGQLADWLLYSMVQAVLLQVLIINQDDNQIAFLSLV